MSTKYLHLKDQERVRLYAGELGVFLEVINIAHILELAINRPGQTCRE